MRRREDVGGLGESLVRMEQSKEDIVFVDLTLFPVWIIFVIIRLVLASFMSELSMR